MDATGDPAVPMPLALGDIAAPAVFVLFPLICWKHQIFLIAGFQGMSGEERVKHNEAKVARIWMPLGMAIAPSAPLVLHLTPTLRRIGFAATAASMATPPCRPGKAPLPGEHPPQSVVKTLPMLAT